MNRVDGPMPISIKSKLILWFLAAFSIVLTGLGFFLNDQLSKIVIDSVDSHLNSEMQFIAGLLRVEQQHGPIETELQEFSQAAVGVYAVALSGHYYQIVSSDGKILIRSPSLSIPDVSLPIEAASLNPAYRTITGPKQAPLRLLNQSFQLTSGILTIQTAESLKESNKLLASFRKILLIVFPAFFILSEIGIWILIDLSLRPLAIFSGRIGRITEKNLNERMDETRTARELRPLAVSFNTMLGRLEEAFSAQRRFLSDASHELRPPASVIESQCDVTLSKARTPEEYHEALRAIAGAADRMTDLIHRILEVSRLDSRPLISKQAGFNLMDGLQNAIKLLSPQASNRGVEIRLRGRPVTVEGDAEKLTEVFLNILDNAVKYNRPGGRVDIDLGLQAAWAVVTVTDTGIGLPEAEREKIFERFYRVEASRSLVPGSGLGLSIARAVVAAHHGRIEVESEPGKGSRFRVFLPIAPPPIPIV